MVYAEQQGNFSERDVGAMGVGAVVLRCVGEEGVEVLGAEKRRRHW